ncbi:hypothetical protein D3C72_2033800 [compost metagenome]
MDDNRLVQLASDADVVAKGRLLAGFRFRRVKIVQPGFAHRDHALFRCHTAQILNVILFILIERMHAAGKGHVIALTHQIAHCAVSR